MRSVPAIAFDYRPSRILFVAGAAASILSLAAIAACGLLLWIKVAVGIPMLAYAGAALHRFLHAPFDRATWHAAGHWRLRDTKLEERPGELVDAITFGPLLALEFRVGHKRATSLLLLPDNCDGETRRRLRVRLARGDLGG